MDRDLQAFQDHDHSGCCESILDTADRLAQEKSLRLTPVRRRVLEILTEAHQAMGAYDVLDRLREDGFGSQPPVAYRALDFLVEHGLVHRIRRLNAFVACTDAGHDEHAPVFLICNECETVAELSGTATAKALRQNAAAIGFQVSRMNIEATGICPACAERSANAD